MTPNRRLQRKGVLLTQDEASSGGAWKMQLSRGEVTGVSCACVAVEVSAAVSSEREIAWEKRRK